MLEMINSHRIHSSTREQARLKEARQYVASLGFHLQVGGVSEVWGQARRKVHKCQASG